MGGCAMFLSLRSSNLMETSYTTPIGALWGARRGHSPLQLAAALYPVWASVPIFLFMAKRALDQRLSDVPPEMAKKIKFMLPGARWLRNRRRQVIKHGLDATQLPTDDALGWRELRRVAPSNQRWLTTY